MDEHSTSALQYGHLGAAIYQPDTQSWTFSRTLSRPLQISYAGVTRETIPPPLSAPQNSRIVSKSALARVHPELAAGWSCLRDERLSQVISTTTDVCDSRVSLIFALGNAVDLNDAWGGRVVPIAVVASGEGGCSISFRKFEEETVELRQHGYSKMRAPTIGASETTEWIGYGAPIRQICFARPIYEKATWMAARLSQATTIFRPLYHRNPVPMQNYNDSDSIPPVNLHNSRLNANPVVDITTAQTGGFAHADVTFNPWYQKQLGIVDERGNWSIWEISGRQRKKKSNWTAECVKSGSLPWLDIGDDVDLNNQPRHDGWAAIEWAGDFSSFIVSDRRCIMLYRTDGDTVLPCEIELGLKRKSEWVLDIQRSPHNGSHIFILTTSRIFLLDVTPSMHSVDGKHGRLSLHPRLYWRHFRDSEDTTLRMSSLIVQESFYLVLYSRLNRFAQAFQCPVSPDDRTNVTSVPDPFILDLPPVSEFSADSTKSGNGPHISDLIFKALGHSSSLTVKTDHVQSFSLVKLFALDSRLAVHESIYITPSGESDGPLEPDILRLKKHYPGVPKRKKTAKNDFIVDDWDESVLSTGILTSPSSRILDPVTRDSAQWTIDFTAVYPIAIGRLIMGPKNYTVHPSQQKDLRRSLEELEVMIRDVISRDRGTTKTLLEILGSTPLLDDIDQNARDFESIVTTRTHQTQDQHNDFRLVQLPLNISGTSPPTGRPDETQTPTKLDLIDTYDCLVNDWLSVLPQDVPGRTRIMKEKAIRGLAADLLLSRINVVPKIQHPTDGESRDSHQGPLLPNTTEYPSAMAVAGRRSSLPLIMPVSHGPEFGEPSSSYRTDAATLEEARSISQNQSDRSGSVFDSLAALTTFTEKRSVSRNVANVLSHWVPGGDPSAYDWQKTAQAIENEGLQATTKARTPKRKSRKKAVQGLGLDSSAIPPSSPAVPVVREWGTQPQDEPPRIQIESSQPMEDDLPMTQVERGIFGGREASRKSVVKARKKKRAAGF